MISPGKTVSHVMSYKQIRAHFKYCQVDTHVQTARESHDLNIDFVHLTMASNSFAYRILCKNKLYHMKSRLGVI